jgi:2-methylisocitrate lyase-like PEP mutase family enzyme
MSEMADNSGRMTDAVDVPLIADADKSYGNEHETPQAPKTLNKFATGAALAAAIK